MFLSSLTTKMSWHRFIVGTGEPASFCYTLTRQVCSRYSQRLLVCHGMWRNSWARSRGNTDRIQWGTSFLPQPWDYLYSSVKMNLSLVFFSLSIFHGFSSPVKRRKWDATLTKKGKKENIFLHSLFSGNREPLEVPDFRCWGRIVCFFFFFFLKPISQFRPGSGRTSSSESQEYTYPTHHQLLTMTKNTIF